MTDDANGYILQNSDKWKEPTMARRSIEERISQLEAQRKTLQAKLGKQDRAKDTRRKILLGALVLYRLEKSGDEEFCRRLGVWLRRELPDFLTHDDDKALFADLLTAPPVPPVPPAPAAPPASEKIDA
jgi:hypothetical protein